jgi:tetratricopeptide (TPR) repeat protein
VGRREDALTAIEEAVKIRRALAAARPDAFLPDLAGSLNNQSNLLRDVGRREDALTAIEEAVKIRRALAAARPDALLPDLAASLNNQSILLRDVGRREDALTAIEEAVNIFGDLGARHPIYREAHAQSLASKRSLLTELGDSDGAR